MPERITTGLRELDQLTGGLPCGSICELVGMKSSGKTALSNLLLARITAQAGICAIIDAHNSFDPLSAQHAGVRLDQTLWIRCAGSLEHALLATDYLLHAGGFCLLLLDLSDLPQQVLRKVPASYWFRFQRVVQRSKTTLLIAATTPLVNSCSALTLQLGLINSLWPAGGAGQAGQPWSSQNNCALFSGMQLRATRLRPGLEAEINLATAPIMQK
jgi:recA bacterial DNA recombination protein